MKTRAERIVKKVDVAPFQAIALENEFGTTLITVIPHISGSQRYTVEIEYVPYRLTDKNRPLECRRN